ncbi:MAG TPA: deaminase [Mycobacteriales bacterium]|nr:deaminase [Mycobacteriales bacterium]
MGTDDADRQAAPAPVDGADAARHVLRALVDREPQRHPLVIGLVAPLGTRLAQVTRSLREGLARYGYDCREIVLSGLLDKIDNGPWGELPVRGTQGYHEKRMDAGDQLRRDTGTGSTLAALGVAEVAPLRRSDPMSTAYVFRSLKHPQEADLLRHVYGDAFWLVGVVTDPDERCDDFVEDLTTAAATFDNPRAEAERLMARDEADAAETMGQQVREVFATADVYLAMRRGYDCAEQVDRFLEGLFGKPFFTPQPDEEAMCLAHDASLRSAAVGRQVGAVLVPTTGTTYVTGTNEVPKPGGGQFWVGDEPDHRDFRTGDDPNPAYTTRMLKELFGRLGGADDWLVPELRGLSGSELLRRAQERDDEGNSLIAGTRAAAVIEFTRCLHAEQAAIANAARQGVSTNDGTMYTTTFPCHECAKFIVGAGIRQVIYVEPYPKSMVQQLYRDLIDTRPPLDDVRPNEIPSKVPFRPYVGFAPSRYDAVFAAGARRSAEGLAIFERDKACPRGPGWSEAAVVEREAAAVGAVTRLVAATYGAPSESGQPETGGRGEHEAEEPASGSAEKGA